MQRILILIANVIGVSMHALICATAFSSCALIGVSNPLFLIYLIAGFVSLISILYDFLIIFVWDKNIKQFAQRKTYICLIIVYNFIVIALYIIAFIILRSINLTLLFYMLAILASNILYIIDLTKEKTRIENDEINKKTIIENINNKYHTISTQSTSMAKNTDEIKNGILFTEDRIVKLYKMKEQGLINEEEYLELKKKIISQI